MPGPVGNKHALGNKGGRPSHFDKSVEAKELIEWAQLDDSYVLRMFAPLRGYSYDTMTRWTEEDDEFRQAYILAKDLVGARRELKLISDGSSSPFQRYATFYDKALQTHEREEKEFEAKLNVAPSLPVNQPEIDKDHQIMELKHKIAQLEANANKSEAG